MDRTVTHAKNRDEHVALMEAIVKRQSSEAFADLFNQFAPKLYAGSSRRVPENFLIGTDR